MSTLAPCHPSGRTRSAGRGLQLPAGWCTGLVTAQSMKVLISIWSPPATLDAFEAKTCSFLCINTGPTAARYSTLFIFTEYLLIIQKIALWINVKVCYSLKTFITYFFLMMQTTVSPTLAGTAHLCRNGGMKQTQRDRNRKKVWIRFCIRLKRKLWHLLPLLLYYGQ